MARGHGDMAGRVWGGPGTLQEGVWGCHLCPPQGVSLELHPGEVLAVVAPPGAGKSTLVSLVLCLRPPGAGRVLLDGHPLPDYQHAYLRCQVLPPPHHTMSPLVPTPTPVSPATPNGSPLPPPCHQPSSP